MTNPIVNINISQQVASAPSLLQQTGAIVTQGGTNTSPGTQTLLTQLSDYTPLIPSPHSITSGSLSSGLITLTVPAHGLPVGDIVTISVAGCTPGAFNGTYLATANTVSTLQYYTTTPLSGFGGSSVITTPGVWTVEDVAETLQQVTTFFSQGTNVSTYLLELGQGGATDGVALLNTWISLNPGKVYSYLVPRTWDGNAAFLAFLPQFENTTSQTYFWVTTTLATWANYTPAMKCVNALIEAPAIGQWGASAIVSATASNSADYSGYNVTLTFAAPHGVAVGQWFTISGMVPTAYNGTFQSIFDNVIGASTTLLYNVPTNPGAETTLGTLQASYFASAAIPSTEFSQAAPFWKSLSYNPSSTNKVAPFGRSFVTGVTAFPDHGMDAIRTALKAAGISVIGTGAAGNISNTLLLWGNMLGGRPFNYWYSVDYAAINLKIALSAAIINGSNNPGNPLYNNQAGITALQGVAASVMSSMTTFGLALGSVIQTKLNGADFAAALAVNKFAGNIGVNAVPFADYYAANPSHYALGIYNGYSVTYSPLRGFDGVTVNLSVTDFVG